MGEQITLKEEAKFLGITFDSKLKFNTQCSNVKEKAVRANAMLRYVNGVNKGMEVNTALMLYKSLVRATIEYGSFIYYPKDEKNGLKLERAQNAGLRTAMGYRNSTPNNVIIGETKVMKIKDRASLLARNFMAKTMIYGDNGLKSKLTELNRKEKANERAHTQREKTTVIGEAWDRVTRDKGSIVERNHYDIFKMNYWQNTVSIKADMIIGKEVKKGRMTKK